MIPVHSIVRRSYSPSSNLILIFDTLCTIGPLFTILMDVVMAVIFYKYDSYTIFIIFCIITLIKYSSIIYNWVIYGVYQCSKSFTSCFKIASEIILIIYMIILLPYIIYISYLILRTYSNSSVSDLDPIYPYLVVHICFFISNACSFRFVILQNSILFNDDFESKYFTRIDR